VRRVAKRWVGFMVVVVWCSPEKVWCEVFVGPKFRRRMSREQSVGASQVVVLAE